MRNLSVPVRTLMTMSNRQFPTDPNRGAGNIEMTALIFEDPIGYLDALGIEAEIVDDTGMPAAA